MKKHYISPTLNVIHLESEEQILSGSREIGVKKNQYIDNETSVLSTKSDIWEPVEK